MIDPIIVQIGPFAIRWYGILIVGGALLAAYAAAREAGRRGQDPELVWDMLLWVLFTGVIGARLYHVFSTPGGGQMGFAYYREHPLEALKIWNGGLAIYGGLAGGMFGLATYVWRHKLDIWLWLDIVMPTVLIGQAIGRWGNFVNQEAYGYPTDLPWGIYIAPEHRLPGLEQYSHFHPTFLYESIGCIAGFFLIAWIARRYEGRLLRGDLFTMYFVWYPLLRLFTESLRADAWRIAGLPTAQWISLIVAIVAIVVIVARHALRAPNRAPRGEPVR